jgi:hypothetical protein
MYDTKTWYEIEYMNCGEWYSSSMPPSDTLESGQRRLTERRAEYQAFQYRLVRKTMAAHHYRQDALREQTRRQITPDHYVFAMPDGKEWLDAERITSDVGHD